jgi:hypothetical protein
MIRILVLATLLFGCNTVKNKENMEESIQSTFTLDGVIQTKTPYCGGARPTEEMAKGTVEPLEGITFYVFNQNSTFTKEKALHSFKTTSSGGFKLDLEPGTYYLVQQNKILSLDEFMQLSMKNMQQSGYAVKSKDCFKSWKESPDFTVQIENNKSEHFTYEAKCFVGINPCIVYSGPKPQ